MLKLLNYFENEEILKKYDLHKASKEEIENFFGRENNTGIFSNIYFTNNGDCICEIPNNSNTPYGLVLSDAQKELFGINKEKNIIFIYGKLTDKHILGLNEDYNYKTQLILAHELEELKYWKQLDRLAFIPIPEVIKYYQNKGYDISGVINEDEDKLVREFLRGELIHLRAEYKNAGEEKRDLDRGVIISTFDKLDLDDEIKQKLKKSYIKAIQILQLIFLLDKKEYFDFEYNLGLLKQNKNIPKIIELILEKFPNLIKYYSKFDSNIIKQIPEKDFLDLLKNPEGKINEIAAKNSTKYKIEKIKIDNGDSWQKWGIPEIDIDGYFS